MFLPRLELRRQIALWLHVIAELSASLLLIFNPSIMVPESSSSVVHQETLRGIGNGALSICLVGIALLFLGTNINIQEYHYHAHLYNLFGFGIIVQYHIGVVILQLRHPFSSDAIPYWLAPLFHGFLVCNFVLEFVNECRSFQKTKKKEERNCSKKYQ